MGCCESLNRALLNEIADIESKVEQDEIDKSKKNNKYDNFTNCFLKELNFSALQCKKYFKDQKPYDSNEQFTDPYFPPTKESLFGLDKNGKSLDPNMERRAEAEKDFKINADEVIWLRPNAIFGDEYAIFEGKIEFDDVRQGSIGNCYFMASLSALTENPEIIAELFRVHSVQKNGYYEVCLKIDGVWNVVIIDDYIPCSINTRRPIFASPKGNELWAILLEKAWAKINGGYIFTVAGFASEVIECMTNFPYEYNKISDTDEEELWKKIIEASGNSYIMTTAIHNEEARNLGLVTGHQYTLALGKLEKINSDPVKLLKIRNPWGSVNFTGDWSQNSDLWNNEAMSKFDYKNTYDGEGEFFIKWSDFLKYFHDVDICKIESRVCMKNHIISYEQSIVPSCYQLRLFEEATVTITIFKPYYRFIKDLPSDWFVCQHLFLAKCDNKEKLEFSEFNGAHESYNDCTMTLKLKPGTYFFYAYVNWSSATDFDFNPISENILKKLEFSVSVYSSEFFGFNKVEEDNMALFHRISANYAKNNNNSPTNHLNIHQVNDWAKSKFYFVYIKSLLNQPANLDVSFDNTYMKSITYSKNKINTNIHPQQEFVAVFSSQNFFEGHGISFKYTYKGVDNVTPIEILPAMNPIPEYNLKSRNLKNYNWIYKKGDVDYKNILKKIDVSEVAFKYFKNQYPKEVELVQAVPKLDNHENLDLYVQDKISIGKKDWYFGEWKDSYEGAIMHGRGYAFISGTTFIGQFENHNFTGIGKKILKNGDIIEGKFQNFKPIGKCSLIHNDGKVEQVEYEIKEKIN